MAMARRDSSGNSANDKLRGQNRKFSEWAASMGRGYQSTDEYEQRKATFIQNDDIIEAQNAKAAASGDPDALTLRHNVMSDKTSEERAAMRGRSNTRGHSANQQNTTRSGRNLSDAPKRELRQSANIDWFSQGGTGPVYSQGGCGSCYSFAANRALEGTIFAKTGQYERISEQHIVDCSTNNSGC
jgi:cathepsin L